MACFKFPLVLLFLPPDPGPDLAFPPFFLVSVLFFVWRVLFWGLVLFLPKVGWLFCPVWGVGLELYLLPLFGKLLVWLGFVRGTTGVCSLCWVFLPSLVE